MITRRPGSSRTGLSVGPSSTASGSSTKVSRCVDICTRQSRSEYRWNPAASQSTAKSPLASAAAAASTPPGVRTWVGVDMGWGSSVFRFGRGSGQGAAAYLVPRTEGSLNLPGTNGAADALAPDRPATTSASPTIRSRPPTGRP